MKIIAFALSFLLPSLAFADAVEIIKVVGPSRPHVPLSGNPTAAEMGAAPSSFGGGGGSVTSEVGGIKIGEVIEGLGKVLGFLSKGLNAEGQVHVVIKKANGDTIDIYVQAKIGG